jgi:hypothetical protein
VFRNLADIYDGAVNISCQIATDFILLNLKNTLDKNEMFLNLHEKVPLVNSGDYPTWHTPTIFLPIFAILEMTFMIVTSLTMDQ